MNKFQKLKGDELEEHVSNYLIPHFSTSGLASFMRNEKAFEKSYIFGEFSGSGASAIAGSAYHAALDFIFKNRECSIVDAQNVIEEYILKKKDVDIKISKRFPSIESVKQEAFKKAFFALNNFFQEKEIYFEDIQEVLFIEKPFQYFVKINGKDFPIPLKGIPDLVYVNKDGDLAILDHKTKAKYTPVGDVDLSYGQQTLSYVKLIGAAIECGEFKKWEKKYPKISEGVKFFNYFENKVTQNRDGSNQIQKIEIDIEQSLPFFEAIFEENSSALLRAVSDPDYIYKLNQDDIYSDKSEMADFWIRSRLEPENFENMRVSAREKILSRKSFLSDNSESLKKIKGSAVRFIRNNAKQIVSLNFETMTQEERIVAQLKNLPSPIVSEVAHVLEGKSSRTFLLSVSAGVKISSIMRANLDIAYALDVENVRINPLLTRYKGKSYIEIEAPKEEQEFVKLPEELLKVKDWKIPIGVNNKEEVLSWDLGNPSTPHLLGGGASGSGKSVSIRSMIQAIEKKQPGAEILILDPKYEFLDLKSKFTVYNEISEIETFMGLLVEEMNDYFKTGKQSENKKVIFFDEVNDALQQARKGKELDLMETYFTTTGIPRERKIGEDKSLKENILMIAQKARSAGIHISLWSQRLSAKAIDGDSKVNFPVRVCFSVPSDIDSRVILDEVGAESLIGKGDGLITSPETNGLERFQAFYSE